MFFFFSNFFFPLSRFFDKSRWLPRLTSSLRFFYKPITLSALACGLVILAYVAMTQDVLEEGRDKRRVYVLQLPLRRRLLAHNMMSQRSICSYRVVSAIRNDPVS